MLTRALPLLLAFLLGLLAGYTLFRRPDTAPKIESTVLLERMQKVAKLITVQGQYSEIYDYNDATGTWYYDWLFQKKALVRVQGTVSVGYDLGSMRMEADPATRTIYLDHLPSPQILSVDHTLDYYDIRNSYFAQFTAEEYNRINEDAKNLLIKKAESSGLNAAAAEQANSIIDMMRFMAESAGWKVVLREGKLNG